MLVTPTQVTLATNKARHHLWANRKAGNGRLRKDAHVLETDARRAATRLSAAHHARLRETRNEFK